MVTPRTLPSGGGPDDSGLGDPTAGPAGPTVVDVAPLVIDLTDELRRDPPSPERPACRPAVPDELARIAAIHAGQLPEGFFVDFGTRFLAAYHATFLAGPYAEALSVGPPGAPWGFVVGTVDNPRHYRWLVRNAGPLARSGMVALSLRPGLAYRVVRTRGGRYARGVLRLLRRRPGAAATSRRDVPAGEVVADAAPVVAVLTHVAVAPEAQGTGLGRVLVEAFIAHARVRGADEIRLIAHAHTSAPGFYRRLGWSSLGERAASDGSLVEEFRRVL